MKIIPFNVHITPMHSGVSGSCFHMKAVFPNRKTYSLLIDCGLLQGKEAEASTEKHLLPFTRNAKTLLITHNHIDHSGGTPALVSDGFRGKIHCSLETSTLLEKAWRDCERIEKSNAAFMKRTPRFKARHVTIATRLIEPYKYGNKKELFPGIWVTFLENGHIYGSSMILLQVNYPYGYEPINFLFTGDYNNKNPFFEIRDLPDEVRNMPLHIICESTYGANERQSVKEEVFAGNITREIEKGKEILIPTFACERGQLVLSILSQLQNHGKLDPKVPIYIDSKLLREYNHCYITAAKKRFKKERRQIIPRNCQIITRHNQREEILHNGVCKIIVTTSGMGTYGPAPYYIKHFIHNRNGVIHFTAGYMCEGSVGRNLQIASEAGKLTQIYGKFVDVQCLVYYTSEFSSHAWREELLQLLRKFTNIKSISLTHGEEQAKKDWAEAIIREKIAKEVGILTRGNKYCFDCNELTEVISPQKLII